MKSVMDLGGDLPDKTSAIWSIAPVLAGIVCTTLWFSARKIPADAKIAVSYLSMQKVDADHTEVSLSLRNAGTHDLEALTASVSCGCTTADLPKRVAAGKTERFKLRISGNSGEVVPIGFRISSAGSLLGSFKLERFKDLSTVSATSHAEVAPCTDGKP